MSKTKKKNLTDLPPRPPADLSEAVLFGAASEVTPEVEADYVNFIYRGSGGKLSEKARKAGTIAVLKMATVGFSFVNWQKGREPQ